MKLRREVDATKEIAEAGIVAERVEGGFHGDFSHVKGALLPGGFESIKSLRIAVKLGIEDGLAERGIESFGRIVGKVREFEKLGPVALSAAGFA